METERRFVGEGFPEIPLTSADLSTYSSTSTYSNESHNNTFYSEFDWHHAAEANRTYYSVGERSDIPPVHLYSGFQPISHNDMHMYPPNSFWHPAQDGTNPGQISMSPLSPMEFRSDSRGSESTGSTTQGGKPKRRRVQTVPQRKAANVRERRRMFHLNEAFDQLRTRLPAFNYEKRLSRIETLRLAMTYIGFMKDVTTGKDPKQIKLLQHEDDVDMVDKDLCGSISTASKDTESDH